MKNIYLQITILSLAILLAGLFIFKKGEDAIKGLFWDVNKSQLELEKDILFCKIDTNACKLKEPGQVNWGVYDFNKTFDNNLLAFNHYFFDWKNQSEINNLSYLFEKAKEKNRWVILTIEPYPTNDDLFSEIQAGKDDNKIIEICSHINRSSTPVFVRWGHEMERVTGRYPWAVDTPQKFIDGYNYFVNKCKSQTKNAYYIWSPAGESNANLYWPDPQNVDYIGLSLYINKEFELDFYKKVRSFDEAFSERYDRFKNYQKPIMIAELGVNVDQTAWLYNMQNNFDKYPLLKTVVYFNAKDTDNVWGKYSTPNWSVDNKIFP